MACDSCVHATREWTDAPTLDRSVVITNALKWGILALLVGLLWEIVWWNIRFGMPMKVAINTAVAFLFTWGFLWKAIPAWRRYWHSNVIARYRWCRVDSSGVNHEHQEPSGSGVEFRLPYSGWRASPAVFRDGGITPSWDIKTQRAEYVLSNLALNGEVWGLVGHHDLTFLMKIVESGMFIEQLLKLLFVRNEQVDQIEAKLGKASRSIEDLELLLVRDEGFTDLFAFLTALREVIQSPEYARSVYAQFVGNVLVHSWPFLDPEQLKDDPRFQKALDAWRDNLRRQAEGQLPKRKAVQPTS
ncbi:MAG: hypothetical protein HY340_02565 [Candidatus Kerfeldbacteria bacterium]|nr:hypothetical protein [Candidatus Kerfeldbacteria bacterium]